eukprot:3719326-Pyramimonas_sp.AAC.1
MVGMVLIWEAGGGRGKERMFWENKNPTQDVGNRPSAREPHEHDSILCPKCISYCFLRGMGGGPHRVSRACSKCEGR